MVDILTYHNLYVTTPALARTPIHKLPFNVRVQCTRVAGWEVWLEAERGVRDEPQLLAGEYGVGEQLLRLDVDGHVIVDSMVTADGSETELSAAHALALHMHAAQRDRAGRPYIEHVARVAGACTDAVDKTIAWLHDVVEDTSMELESLRDVFSNEVVDAVDALTWRQNENYLGEYIPRLVLNPRACRVKLHDLADNMNLSRLPTTTRESIDRWLRYEQAHGEVQRALYVHDAAPAINSTP